MAFMDVLPDPNRRILDSGKGGNNTSSPTTGTAGPGFASVKFASVQPTMVSRTNGGRVVTRAQATQYWKIDISYNPLTRAEFEPVNSFLMSKQGRLTPFYVVLPQHDNPRSGFTTIVRTDEAATSGATKVKVDDFGNATAAGPRPGDLFTVTDTTNSNHVKAYMVTRVETNTDYEGIQPAAAERVIHFNPPLTYSVGDNTVLNFTNPRIRVISQKNAQEYSLSTDNLFNFSLSLEEALP
jgi:hypothetical protein